MGNLSTTGHTQRMKPPSKKAGLALSLALAVSLAIQLHLVISVVVTINEAAAVVMSLGHLRVRHAAVAGRRPHRDSPLSGGPK
jgi:hypothetical protein